MSERSANFLGYHCGLFIRKTEGDKQVKTHRTDLAINPFPVSFSVTAVMRGM